MSKPVHIFVVDDDELDVLHVKRILDGSTEVASITVAIDGLDALEQLRNGRLSLHRLIMLVDWRMPRMNGKELLEALRADPALRCVPVIIMTTSADECDRVTAYELGAAGYFVKPGSSSPFRAIMESICKYWSLAEFPPVQK